MSLTLHSVSRIGVRLAPLFWPICPGYLTNQQTIRTRTVADLFIIIASLNGALLAHMATVTAAFAKKYLTFVAKLESNVPTLRMA